jgi:uncharacterized membrane protein
MVLPALERSLDRPAQAAALVAIERRALALVAVSLVWFVVTGTYLLVSNPHHAGLGDFFASTCTTLMVVKHVLVIRLVVLGAYVDRHIRHLGEATSESARESAHRRLGLSAERATGPGALIVLLTAAACAAARAGSCSTTGSTPATSASREAHEVFIASRTQHPGPVDASQINERRCPAGCKVSVPGVLAAIDPGSGISVSELAIGSSRDNGPRDGPSARTCRDPARPPAPGTSGRSSVAIERRCATFLPSRVAARWP